MYTLRFPFQTVAQYSIEIDEDASFELDELSVAILQQGGWYIVQVSGFDSADAASAFSSTVYSALLWAVLERTTPFEAQTSVDLGHPIADPDKFRASTGLKGPAELLVDGNRPSAYKSDLAVRTVTAGSVGVSLSLPLTKYAPAFQKGLERSRGLQHGDRFRTALELFNAHFVEATSLAKFVVLIMCLEVLAEPQDKHEAALELLGKWSEELDNLRQETDEEEIRFALDSLERELIFRKEDSLRSRVRRLVQQSAVLPNGPEFDALVSRAVELYDLRSTLIHTGVLEESVLSRALTDARELVRALLKKKFDGSTSA